jgi:phage tail sheath protein FI
VTNSHWKYITVRRFFIFLERSIDEGTQWVVFELNGASRRRRWVKMATFVGLAPTQN